MYRRIKKEKIFSLCYFFADLFFLFISYYLSTYIKFFIEVEENLSNIGRYYLIYSLVGILLTLTLLYLRKLYDSKYLKSKIDFINIIIQNILISTFVIIGLNYYFDRNIYQISRIWLIYTAIFSIVLIIFERLLIYRFLNLIFNKVGISNRIAIIGINEEGRRIAVTLQKNKIEKNEIIGFIIDEYQFDNINSNNKFDNFNILGSLDNLKKIIKNNNINRLIISSVKLKYFEIEGLADLLSDKNIEIQLSPSLFEFSVSRLKMFEETGILFIQVKKIEFSLIDKVVKAFIDYFIGIMIFIFFIILLPLIAILIKLDSIGPIFYKQKRYGKDFKIIEIYKFRTMVNSADKNYEILKKLYNKSGSFKIKNDPRITRVGKFLRKTSLDEFPQVLNVLKGELSIVGPRALVIEEGDVLEDWEKKRMVVKQGITGLWQVSGRSDLDYEERMKLDLFYIQNWSIWLELKIIFLTIIYIIIGKGAY